MTDQRMKMIQASKGQIKRLSKQEEKQFDISEILDARKTDIGFEYFVRWEGYGPKYDSWIPEQNLDGDWAKDEAEKFIIDKKSELLDVKVYQQKCTARHKSLRNGIIIANGETRTGKCMKVVNSEDAYTSTFPPAIKRTTKQKNQGLEERKNENKPKTIIAEDDEDHNISKSLHISEELRDFECPFINYSNELEKKLTDKYDSFLDINYGSMIQQTREQFLQGAYKQILQQFRTTQLYSVEVQQLPPQDIFKKPYWHPGKQDQSTLTCFITASNMVAGGPIFDSPQKFHALYESRTHMSNKRKLEMPWEEGYCYKNLPFLFFDPNDDQWYSPVFTDQISGVILRNMKENKHQGWWGLLQTNNPYSKFIIQVLVITSTLENGVVKKQQQCHAAAVVKDNDKWLLLDSAEEGPLEITPDGGQLKEWYDGVYSIGMLAICPDNPPPSKREAFKREWYRFLNGEKVIKQGGNRMKIKSSRKSSRKDRRTNPHNKGNKQNRSNKQAIPQSIPRKSRSEQLIGKRADRGRDMDAKTALFDSTLNGRLKRKLINSERERARLETLQKCQAQIMIETEITFGKLQKYIETIKKMMVLPFPDQLQKQVLAPEKDREIISAAYSWVALRGPRSRLDHFKQQMISDGGALQIQVESEESEVVGQNWVEQKFEKVLLQIEENLYCFVYKMLQDNPTIPLSFVTRVKRILSKTKATGLQWRYDSEIKQQKANMIKDNDPRKMPDDSMEAYLAIEKIIKNL
ncbi:Chromo domain containing protein [Oxytricha trifallax]|uniref:Chromo domain containing protein n=1 Tax=Oxytricha trifallax TaxID=1172189 RepID=A0A073HX13_9SPIT|nr:Chromo domain containing protein [Oxytricha trifallax]